MNIRIITIALLLATLPVSAQKKKTVVNDSNTPLHLLQPAYQGTYGDLTPGQVKKDIDRVFAYIDKETPARVVDKNTGKLITDYTTMGEEAQLERGAFRLASYEWGVTYSALIAAAEATGDQRYMDYVQNRFRFLAEVAPHFKRVYEEKGTTDPQLLQILTPHALDDAGAVCAAMVKVRVKDRSLPVDGLIGNYFDFIQNKEYRLADGTFAENREESSFIWENFYDEEERINEYDLTLFIKEGELFRKFEETHYQRCYSLDEVKEAAKEAGMDFVAAYDAFTRESVKDDSERIYLVFRERGK